MGLIVFFPRCRVVSGAIGLNLFFPHCRALSDIVELEFGFPSLSGCKWDNKLALT